MKTLERGKLYQVRHFDKGWIIAEYMGGIPAGIAHGYRSRDGARSWHEPARHNWRYVHGEGMFTLADKGMQVRPVSPESLERIAELRAAIVETQLAFRAALKALREFCE